MNRFLPGVLALLLCVTPARTENLDLLLPNGPDRTMRVRLSVTIEGQSLEQRETEFLRSWFRFRDPKGTGRLDQAAIRQTLRYNPLRQPSSGSEVTRETLGLAADQTATIDDLVARYQRQPVGRFLALEAPLTVAPYQDLLTQAIARALDRDGDGRLSRAELEAAERVLLAAFDADGDDCLIPLEIVPDLLNIPPAGPIPSLTRPATLTLAGNEKPDAEVRLEAGQATIRQVRNQAGLRLDTLASPAIATAPINLMELVRTTNKDNRGFVELKDLTGRELTSLRRLHPAADRDGDGKLTPDELQSFLALNEQAARSVCTLTVVPRQRGWFEILDRNRDGRLGVRELRQAWELLADDQALQRGYVEVPDLKRPGYSLTLSRGPRTAGPSGGILASAPVSARGPAWFRQLDQNGDGDLSWQEFIGSREMFRFYDRDGDGLISHEEAEAGDARKEKTP